LEPEGEEVHAERGDGERGNMPSGEHRKERPEDGHAGESERRKGTRKRETLSEDPAHESKRKVRQVGKGSRKPYNGDHTRTKGGRTRRRVRGERSEEVKEEREQKLSEGVQATKKENGRAGQGSRGKQARTEG
jgi:hypothetical protein